LRPWVWWGGASLNFMALEKNEGKLQPKNEKEASIQTSDCKEGGKLLVIGFFCRVSDPFVEVKKNRVDKTWGTSCWKNVEEEKETNKQKKTHIRQKNN